MDCFRSVRVAGKRKTERLRRKVCCIGVPVYGFTINRAPTLASATFTEALLCSCMKRSKNLRGASFECQI